MRTGRITLRGDDASLFVANRDRIFNKIHYAALRDWILLKIPPARTTDYRNRTITGVVR